MLYESLKQECVTVALTETDDGLGGITRTWTQGQPFSCYIQRITSVDSQVANKASETATYLITTSKDNILKYHDVVKRTSDNAVFRVLSEGADQISPSYMAFVGGMSQVTAERWDTNG